MDLKKQSPKSTLNEKKSKIKVDFNLLKLLNKNEIQTKEDLKLEILTMISKLKAELKPELKEELKPELKAELKEELKAEILQEMKEENTKRDTLTKDVIRAINSSIQELLKCTDSNNDKINKINLLNEHFIQLFQFFLNEQKDTHYTTKIYNNK